MTAAGRSRPRSGVVEHLLEQVERVDVGPEVAVVGQARDVAEGDARGIPVRAVAGRGERADAETVEGVRERDHVRAAGRLAGDLERRLDGVRAGRPGELQLVVEAARHEHVLLERLDERLLGRRGHVEPVDDAVALEVLDERTRERGVVVAVVQHARAGEEVEVLAAVGVDEGRAARSVEDRRERADVPAHLRLAAVEDVQGCGVAHGVRAPSQVAVRCFEPRSSVWALGPGEVEALEDDLVLLGPAGSPWGDEHGN